MPFLPILILLFSCSGKENQTKGKENEPTTNKIISSEFESIIDSANVKGSILLYDLEGDKFYSNDFEWAQSGHLPASTYKITSSIIALETGKINNDSTVLIWNREPRRLEIWEQDLTLKDAFHFSCVPCYQEVARNIGVIQMKEYLDKLDYGNIIVDTTNVDMFWLEGDSRITQFQQIDFLKRFYLSDLPISERTETIMKRMMLMEENEYYRLTGKRGMSVTNDLFNGWFVGYIEVQEKVYFFATNIEPLENCDMSLFPSLRKDLTIEALEQLRIVN